MDAQYLHQYTYMQLLLNQCLTFCCILIIIITTNNGACTEMVLICGSYSEHYLSIVYRIKEHSLNDSSEVHKHISSCEDFNQNPHGTNPTPRK